MTLPQKWPFVAKLAILALLTVRGVSAQPLARLTITKFDMGSVTTELGFNIKVNPASSLHRVAYVINDLTCPLALLSAGIGSKYVSSSGFDFVAVGDASLNKGVSAIEVRFVLLDVFGDRMETLSGSEIRDFAADSKFQVQTLGWKWGASETRVTDLGASIAFVARVRLADGTVWRYEPALITAELAKIRLAVSPDELKPALKKVDQ